ncbi:MAG: hypothetical protein V8S58_02675 [Lachnospiraceae bacterium]
MDLMEPDKCQIHGAFFLDLKAAEYSGKMPAYIPDSWHNYDLVVVMAFHHAA